MATTYERALETGCREKTRGWSIITQVAHSNFLKKQVGEKTGGGQRQGKAAQGYNSEKVRIFPRVGKIMLVILQLIP